MEILKDHSLFCFGVGPGNRGHVGKSGIVLGTLNVKNIETNIVHVEKLLKKNVIFYFSRDLAI